LKIQREEEKAKKERKKEKKRVKKEKEKTREKAHENGEIDNKKHRHKKRPREERSQEDQKGGDPLKRRKYETENLEKSSLTEEHGHPVGSQNSSDSTLNSNKRQKRSLSSNGKHNSGESHYVSSFPGEGCLLVGFVSFTVTLIFFFQLLIIYVKGAFSGSGCLCKGTKILKCYSARNSLALPREGLRLPLLKRCMNLLLVLAETQENIAVLLLEMWANNQLSSSAKSPSLPPKHPKYPPTRLNQPHYHLHLAVDLPRYHRLFET
jgi:hypothetical protein